MCGYKTFGSFVSLYDAILQRLVGKKKRLEFYKRVITAVKLSFLLRTTISTWKFSTGDLDIPTFNPYFLCIHISPFHGQSVFYTASVKLGGWLVAMMMMMQRFVFYSLLVKSVKESKRDAISFCLVPVSFKTCMSLAAGAIHTYCLLDLTGSNNLEPKA